MPCYHPISGFRSKTVNESGKRSIVFNPNQGFRDQPMDVPCGQCIGCRLERSRQWAIRCVHETQLHAQNAFLTLTYRPEALPRHGSLVKKHFVDFMKRYRFWLNEDYQKKLRFFMCGEYGENFGRPHYHAIIFGHDFHDKTPYKKVGGNLYWKSAKLEELWTHGHCIIGEANFETAAYVARYVTKKINGDKALEHYNKIDLKTGEVLSERIPEYVTMSRRPGVGREWYNRFKVDVFPADEVVLRGKQLKPPKYYDKLHELEEPTAHAITKRQRIAEAKQNAKHNTWERLLVREEIKQDKFKQLKRNFENED